MKSTGISWWKKELCLSVYDLKNYAALEINQVDRRPLLCPLTQGCQRRRLQSHFARRSDSQIRIEEFLGAFPKLRKATASFVMTTIIDSSEISPTRCNNCAFILRSGFTLHVSGDNLTHHQEYICCIWPQVSRLT